jgi:hypothetical protein
VSSLPGSGCEQCPVEQVGHTQNARSAAEVRFVQSDGRTVAAAPQMQAIERRHLPI